MDQPAGLLDRYAWALDVFQALASWKQCPPAKIGEWIAAHPDWNKLRDWVEKLRDDGR